MKHLPSVQEFTEKSRVWDGAVFDEKLKKYGYFDEAADSYTIGYYQRDLYCFAVDNGFPKITKEAVPMGVADITYRVSIMLCMPYAQDIKSVFEVLKGGA